MATLAESGQRMQEAVSWLADPQASRLPHAELERRVQGAGRNCYGSRSRIVFDLRAAREKRLPR